MISGSILFLIILLCLLAKGFFSGSETAMVHFNGQEPSDRPEKPEEHIREYVQTHQRLLVTTKVGSTLAVVAGTVLMAQHARLRWGNIGELYTLLIMAPMFILIGEIIPRVVFQHYAEGLAKKLPRLLNFWRWVFMPLVVLIDGFGRLLRKALRAGKDTLTPFVSREELQVILTGPDAATELEIHERQMIDRIFDFSETMVEDTMVPLIEVQALEHKTRAADALPRVLQNMHSRYPIYRERIDDIIGLLYSTDLVDVEDQTEPLDKLMRPCVYVPETLPVSELLARMQKHDFSMAVAVDEYGGCVGVITREDILEEVVGEIEDEYDEEMPLIQAQAPGRWLVSARVEIDEIEEDLGLEIPEGPYETLGGFLLTRFLRVPQQGEKLKFSNWTFVIVNADERSIHEVQLNAPGTK